MVKWRFRTRRVWGLLATSCLVAGAQGAPYRAKPARHASPLAPENIQVSGTRQAALRAQPGTVNILTGAHIRQRNVRTPKDIASLVPGMTAVNATSGSTPIFSIRGVGLDDYSGSDMSGIGIYLDGVFAPYPVFYAGQIMDVQSVSVEKGPQGFTFGRSTTSGSVTIESVKPSDRFGGYADFGYGSYNTKTASLAINTPLDAHVQNRFAFSDVNGDGWQHDILSDRRFSSQDVLGLRNLTRFILDDRSQLLLNLH